MIRPTIDELGSAVTKILVRQKFRSARAKICDKFGPPLKFLVRAQRLIIWRRATLASAAERL